MAERRESTESPEQRRAHPRGAPENGLLAAGDAHGAPENGLLAVGDAHGVPDIQRARILGALVEVARELGARRVTVAAVVARSGVSRRTFYELFADSDACFLAAFDDAVETASARVLPALRRVAPAAERPGRGSSATASVAADGCAAHSWRARTRAGLLALLEFLDAEPGLGGLCVVDALGAGPAVFARRSQVIGALVDAVDAGRASARAGSQPSRLTAEAVVGGVLSVLYARLVEDRSAVGEADSLTQLLNPLMEMIVLPYLGPAAARRESAQALPVARLRSRRTRSNPLEGLEMRLTYRTIRVLVAVATTPDASNREVADAAGVVDPGQMSKLLGRLEHLGLVENAGGGSTRGEPNAWRLTRRGSEVEQAIVRQADRRAG